MNKLETWRYLAEYFHGKTDALKEGIGHVISDLWRSETIDSKTTDQVSSELPMRCGDIVGRCATVSILHEQGDGGSKQWLKQ